MKNLARLNMHIGILIPIALVLFLAPAQTSDEARDSYDIVVTGGNGTCTYEIMDHDDQDLFEIEPRGKVNFEAVGSDVFVHVSSGLVNGETIPGQGPMQDRAFTMKKGNKAVFVVREPRAAGFESMHKINIECASGTSTIPANPGTSGASVFDEIPIGNHGGPTSEANETQVPVVSPGGPEMKVKDE